MFLLYLPWFQLFCWDVKYWMFSVEARGFHMLFSRAACGSLRGGSTWVPPPHPCRAQGCSSGNSAWEGEQSLGKWEVLWQHGDNNGMGREKDRLILFRAEPCGNSMSLFGSEQQVPQLSCSSQEQDGCGRRAPALDRFWWGTPEDANWWAALHLCSYRQIQLYKCFISVEKFGYDFYKDCSVRLDIPGNFRQSALGLVFITAEGGGRPNFL